MTFTYIIMFWWNLRYYAAEQSDCRKPKPEIDVNNANFLSQFTKDRECCNAGSIIMGNKGNIT